LEKGKVATCEFTSTIEVLLNASKVFKNQGTKKEIQIDLLSCLAPLIQAASPDGNGADFGIRAQFVLVFLE
jgi:hypothetical protein